MMRRIQNKEMEKKMESERAAIRRAADSEKRVGEAQIDEAELERIRKRQAGTMVTMETFVAWKKNFDEEMARKQDSQAANKGMEKVSGKQWFLNQQASGVPASWLAEEDELLAKLSAEVEQEQLQEVEEEEEDSEEDEDYVDEGGDDDDDDDADESESI